MSINVKIEAYPGAPLGSVVYDSLKVAITLNQKIEVSFNGDNIIVDPSRIMQDIIGDWETRREVRQEMEEERKR